ncbi:MAG: ABC transporter ATP-binding protein [Chloroflexi bacterium]|nr:ABC transporter ATP-binding protein [Chloroflexota bacterium]MCI0773181.1 ABC transporter ATP-binding protein [Chloroflexota bacterium]MCI0827517.1 ABC transporter ATP-binding protein [Chloroflexota bacterium]MCI0854389.1 ABC transporter ATP-binding protein [Chloroflexota bacterium]MCI0862012.1 ABC transporter ATP-binding protein [Chloroflexota bacterium]
MTPILTATDLSLVYPNGNGGLQALDRVTFSAQRNEFLCVIGASGSGKTTLLRLLGGLLNPTEGEVQFEGERMIGPRRRIGFVFQAANLMPWRSALENVKLPLELQGTNSGANSRRAAELLKLVGLVDFENTLPRDLSGGMAQRVAIARALVHEPDLLLLDEPFGSLDALTRERMIFELLRIWQMRKVTILMVTHSIWEAVLMADRVLVLSQRPGSIRLDLEMPLSRPRSLDMMHTPEFGKLVDQVRSAIE